MPIVFYSPGTAIEVFCIAPPLTTNAITDYHLNFTLDGGTRHGTFSYAPSSSTQFVYNLSVVALQGLENVAHELVVSTDDSDVGSVFLFDYAVYSVPVTLESKSNLSKPIRRRERSLAVSWAPSS
ncbi:hypothetical protein FB45DRAFT_1037332 [Roridomyces roridus]|uniref:Uncharacterized protein n=1 Tax=Roridomyces roridus TaxID=1738132 RepID=A0AAD7FCC1_9AGAR|nr:hypothetical protein FB45DRAFT_1037332 [Roridomyces roridus]